MDTSGWPRSRCSGAITPGAKTRVSRLERDSGGWVAAYNLGLIEDRLGDPEAVIDHLETALASGLSDRYQLLARLWLARNHHRAGSDDDARKQIALLHQEKKGCTNGSSFWTAIKARCCAVCLERMFGWRSS